MTRRTGLPAAIAASVPATARAAGTAVTGRPRRPSWRPGTDRLAVRHPAPPADPDRASRAPSDPRVLVIGGGIAGVAAATALVERGVRTTLVEAQPRLGGRVAAWPVDVAGEPARMSRGFHAFFRQYYNLRAILRRVDPALEALRPVGDYPLQHLDGSRDSFARIPRTPPFNILGFVARSPSFRPSDLPRVDLDAALRLLDVDFPRTFIDHDGVSASDVLDALRFPEAMRHLALEVFARSFFADPSQFSGGELVAMFHAYFLGSAEGLLFDVAGEDFDTCWWSPFQQRLQAQGVDLRFDSRVSGLERHGDGVVATVDGRRVEADAVVIATDRAGLQKLVAASPWLGDPRWRGSVADAPIAPRFLVQRLWLDTPVAPSTPAFLGTAAFGRLDNVSAIHLIEADAADWARRHGGSVLELHAYAVPDEVSDAQVLADLRTQLDRLHPELANAAILHEETLVHADCPLVGTDPWLERPGVQTPDPAVVLAGDGIRCELPVALMERAATTGIQAANTLLERWGRPGHDLYSVPTSARFPVVARLGRRAVAAGGRRAC